MTLGPSMLLKKPQGWSPRIYVILVLFSSMKLLSLYLFYIYHFVAMPLASSDKKTLENMVYRITCRMSAGEDDFDSDYERDLVMKLTNYLWEV